MNTVNKAVAKPSAIGQQVKILTGEKIVDTLKVSADEGKLMIEYAQLAEGATKKNQKLVEMLYANDKRSYHFVGANDEDKGLVAFRNQVLDYLTKGLDAESQRLIKAEPKSLKVSEQAVRTLLVTKNLPTLFGNIKKAMVRFETKALSGETEKAKPKTNEQMVHYYVNQALEKITKCKNGWEGMLKDKQALEALAVRKQVKLPK